MKLHNQPGETNKVFPIIMCCSSLMHYLIVGHHLTQRHGDESNGHIFPIKPNVVLEEKLPLYHNKPNQKRFPPLYDAVPIADRLIKAQNLDQSITNKSKINKPRPPDEQKSQAQPTRTFPKIFNDNGVTKHDKNENFMNNEDAKSDSIKSWGNVYPLSGINKRQIPSQIGQSETFSEYDLTQHDPQCQSVLDISFPSNGNPTLGLPRSVVPNDSELERYATLVEKSIPGHMVAPISKMLVDGTHRNVPKQLVEHFKGALKELDEVRENSYQQ